MAVALAMLVKDPPLDRMAALVAYVRPVVSEVVIVVDSRTSPQAVDAMRTWGVTLVPFDWVDDFAEARNAALSHISADWTLHLDPDELPSAALLDFIRAVDTEPQADVNWQGMRYPAPRGYLIWTVNYFEGVKGEEWEEHWHCRLFLTRAGRWYRPVHELVALDGYHEAQTRGTPYLPKAPKAAKLIHSKSAEHIPEAHELYTRIEAIA